MLEHIVYCCHTETEVLYIGHGKLGREKHCNSGVSHVYELNKQHFLHNDLIVVVLKHFATKKEAKDYEEQMIKDTLPKFNKSVKISEKKSSDSFGWLDSINKNRNSIELIKSIGESK